MSGWTEARLARLKRDFAEGLTCAESAERLGVTSLAVRNKRQRLGLARPRPLPAKRPATPPVPAAQAARDSARRRFLPRLPAPPAEPPPEILLGGADLTRCKVLTELGRAECRWPIEATLVEPSAATRFCARRAEPRGAYCAEHARTARRATP